MSAKLWTAEEATQQLMSVLPLMNRIIAIELHKEAGEDTTMPQFRVITLLAENPMTLSMVARKRRTSLQSAGELVQALVERGWVERIPDPADRRQSQLRLTRAGTTYFDRSQSGMLNRLVPVMEKLNPVEIEAVQRAFSALQRVLVEALPEENSNDSH